MRKFKFVLAITAILFSSSFMLAQDTVPNDPPPTEENVVETETPVWVTVLISLVTTALGIWGGRTQFADKTGQAKAKALQKVQEADNLFETLNEVIRSGSLTENKVDNIVRQWKVIVNKD